MRILHLLYESKGDYFGIGGAGIRSYEIYRNLKQRHDITLLCKKYPGARDADIEGLRHIFVGVESRSLTKTLLSYAFNADRFVKKREAEFDIIVEDFSPAVPTFLNMLTKKPCILQVQGYTGSLYFRKYNPAYGLVLRGLELMRPRFYRNFIVINKETIKRLALGYGASVEIIPNGISPELLAISSEEGEYILYLGRIDIYGKGLDLLADAYNEFYKFYPGVRLVIAGEGKDMERFKTRLRGLPHNVRNNIELPGWVSGDRKKRAIQKALFVVLPSRHEVQGITALESMAAGKPLIVSDIPELSYIVEHKAGLPFESGDALKLASAMRLLTERKEERRQMGVNGKNWVRDFTWDRIAAQYENFLLKVSWESSREKKP